MIKTLDLAGIDLMGDLLRLFAGTINRIMADTASRKVGKTIDLEKKRCQQTIDSRPETVLDKIKRTYHSRSLFCQQHTVIGTGLKYFHAWLIFLYDSQRRI
jgi:hypothetical protein